MFGRLRADGQQREQGRRGWRVGGGGGHRDLHTGGVNGMWPGGKEGQGPCTISRGNVRSRTAGRGVAWVLMEKKWKQWRPGRKKRRKRQLGEKNCGQWLD